MMRLSYLILLTLTIAMFSSCNTKTSSEDHSFKVMTWNIWHGGVHGTKLNKFKKDRSNTINIQKVLEQNEADVLFMQETYCCGMEIAKKAGYVYSSRGNSNLSIHSKFPIVEEVKYLKGRNSQGVVVKIQGKRVLCVNIWLNWLPDYLTYVDTLSVDSIIAGEHSTRAKEMSDILARIDSVNMRLKLPVVMGGDFNSSSHLDWNEKNKQWHFNKILKWPTSIMTMEKGFKDSYRTIYPTPNVKEEITWGFHGEAGYVMSDRIDFIYYTPSMLDVLSSMIVKDDPKGAFFSSDHRAILSSFRFK
ncbi:endonuclease/exonuclease/phosphatase family protein [Halosquirtibacter xylanolyticus]|uniref:endonuclease/exonuclease/phosphatase family protein n=1 Tax=Halosquirtibacter xylanolyticus TaxID=3374599 RepID=UPI003748E401|nr:endonuclease/exonuclease/phosphatase family protein [Prolixibacteraceae bacterium]